MTHVKHCNCGRYFQSAHQLAFHLTRYINHNASRLSPCLPLQSRWPHIFIHSQHVELEASKNIKYMYMYVISYIRKEVQFTSLYSWKCRDKAWQSAFRLPFVCLVSHVLTNTYVWMIKIGEILDNESGYEFWFRL